MPTIRIYADTYTKIADAADDPITAQVIEGPGMIALFSADDADDADDGLHVKTGDAVTRAHGTGHLYAKAKKPLPGMPAQSALVRVQL